jgi:hypothetical protein
LCESRRVGTSRLALRFAGDEPSSFTPGTARWGWDAWEMGTWG